jgi:hypothetical protein
MPGCNNCGAFVTRDFVRVFGNNDQELFGCLACSEFTSLIHGAGATGDGNRSDRGVYERRGTHEPRPSS